jgi:hypothetical protein
VLALSLLPQAVSAKAVTASAGRLRCQVVLPIETRFDRTGPPKIPAQHQSDAADHSRDGGLFFTVLHLLAEIYPIANKILHPRLHPISFALQ